MLLPVPPPDEQAAVVSFLDHANRRIERYIRGKRKLIALLNEQKQAIIHRAMTRGLDPNVPMKDSGVPWLGEIPAHWEVRRVNVFAQVGNGSTPSRAQMAYWTGGTYPWLNSSQVNRGCIDSSDQFVTSTALMECHLPRVRAGSLLIAITGQGKTRGMSAVLRIEATINQHLAYVTLHYPLVSSEFLHLAFVAAYPALRALSDDSGSTKGALTCQDIKRFKLPVPPALEQEQLVNNVRAETRILDLAASRAEREIALMREYRTRLVADVVTGQLDVRDAARSLQEFEPDAEALESDADDAEAIDEDVDVTDGEAA